MESLCMCLFFSRKKNNEKVCVFVAKLLQFLFLHSFLFCFFSKPFSKLGRRGEEGEGGASFFFFNNDLLLPIEKTFFQRQLRRDNSMLFSFRNMLKENADRYVKREYLFLSYWSFLYIFKKLFKLRVAKYVIFEELRFVKCYSRKSSQQATAEKHVVCSEVP